MFYARGSHLKGLYCNGGVETELCVYLVNFDLKVQALAAAEAHKVYFEQCHGFTTLVHRSSLVWKNR